ncbi:hypothetical protein EKO27_g7624 [Xylaria grammica]|uniref:Sequence orphan n=1 Tax=Xylaria grammica TaxID=363999 RepID=A0A439CZ35_9PEZI|nr:hypothetical protein EKO27_g7624 [Xylaria grammica]
MKGDNISNLTETVPVPGLPLDTKSVPAPPKQQAVEMPSKLSRQWNTKNLGFRLGGDAASAACAASMIAPFISIIDRSIMENASGRSTLAQSLKTSVRTFFTRPHTTLFSRPVALIFVLYGGTYLTANTLDTASSTVYVKLFGPGGPPRPVPLPTYALFTLRDCLTIFASFNVPPLFGPIVSERLSVEMRRGVSGETIAQFAAPAAVQLFSTPIHLLGLDIYNRPASAGGASWAHRWALIRKNWLISCAARICRIVPAFGLGGTVNMKVRRNLMERLS